MRITRYLATESPRGGRVVSKNQVIGGKKLALALKSIEQKITNAGVMRVGFLEGARYPERTNAKFLKAVGSKAAPKVVPSISIAQAAFWNEFGTLRTPSRPFFRTTIAKQSKTWGDKLSKAIVATNYDGQKALGLLGQAMRDDVESSIAQWSSPGNATLTIKIKGFDKPLVGEMGLMQRAVDYEVKPK
jgi:hypothetical protein